MLDEIEAEGQQLAKQYGLTGYPTNLKICTNTINTSYSLDLERYPGIQLCIDINRAIERIGLTENIVGLQGTEQNPWLKGCFLQNKYWKPRLKKSKSCKALKPFSIKQKHNDRQFIITFNPVENNGNIENLAEIKFPLVTNELYNRITIVKETEDKYMFEYPYTSNCYYDVAILDKDIELNKDILGEWTIILDTITVNSFMIINADGDKITLENQDIASQDDRDEILAKFDPELFLSKQPPKFFYNSFTMLIRYGKSNMNCKVFPNGKVHLTGVKCIDDAEYAQEVIKQELINKRCFYSNIWESLDMNNIKLDCIDEDNYKMVYNGLETEVINKSKLSESDVKDLSWICKLYQTSRVFDIGKKVIIKNDKNDITKTGKKSNREMINISILNQISLTCEKGTLLFENIYRFDNVINNPIKVSMMNSTFSTGVPIDRQQLCTLLQNYGYFAEFDPCNHQGVNLKYPVPIFNSLTELERLYCNNSIEIVEKGVMINGELIIRALVSLEKEKVLNPIMYKIPGNKWSTITDYNVDISNAYISINGNVFRNSTTEDKSKRISILTFRTGSIVITGAKKLIELYYGLRFIVNFIYDRERYYDIKTKTPFDDMYNGLELTKMLKINGLMHKSPLEKMMRLVLMNKAYAKINNASKKWTNLRLSITALSKSSLFNR